MEAEAVSDTHRHFHDLTRAVNQNLGYLRSESPDLMKGFGDLATVATKDGVLDAKTKELIAMALSVAGRCDPCIGFHAKALVRLGATKQELAEALGVAIYMGGGPSLMYSANALAAMDEFTAATTSSATIAAG
ncbi:MAG: carboxymuconolactone decarboxylase family protein [Burkholderiales bacterium]|nr:carboxymuconolactone decarboxylase family protein [Burkholderiales bacterium]